MNLIDKNIKLLLKSINDKGFFHLLSANVLIQLFAFASQLFVAGILSPDDIGRIKIIQTYLSIFSIVAGMGFNASTLKICSENRTKKEKENYFNAALVFTLLSSITVYAIVFILNLLGIITKDSIIKVLIPIGLFPLITNSLFSLFTAFFQSQKKIKLFSTLTLINKILSIFLIIVFTYLLKIKGYFIAYNLSILTMVVMSFFLLKKEINFTFKLNKNLLKDHWAYAGSNTIAYIVSELTAYLDIILISFLVTDIKQIGYYSFALTLTVALGIFPLTVQQISIPYISSNILNKKEFFTTFNKYNRILHVVVIVSLILFLMIMPLFISLVFQGKYDNSLTYLNFLAVGWSIRNMNHLKSGAIFGLGKIHYNAYAGLVNLIACIIVYPVLIYLFGLMGAAYASIISGIVFYVSFTFYFHKTVNETF